MGRPRKVLGDSSSAVIEENILREEPEAIDSSRKVVKMTHIPEYRKVMFLNGRDSGYPLDFHYASKTHPLKTYHLVHGKEYNLPVEIIDHLESCAENQYGYRQGAEGHPEMYVKGKKYLFSCRSSKDQRVA